MWQQLLTHPSGKSLASGTRWETHFYPEMQGNCMWTPAALSEREGSKTKSRDFTGQEWNLILFCPWATHAPSACRIFIGKGEKKIKITPLVYLRVSQSEELL